MAENTTTRLIHQGNRFTFEELRVNRNGHTIAIDAVRGRGAVVIVPVLDDGQMVLIRNHRAVVSKILWEFCAGGMEVGEEPLETARRELIEETGYEAAQVEHLGTFYTSPGFCDEHMHAYVARGLRHVGQRLEHSEEIAVMTRTPEQVWSMIDGGELIDAKSIVAMTLYERRK